MIIEVGYFGDDKKKGRRFRVGKNVQVNDRMGDIKSIARGSGPSGESRMMYVVKFNDFSENELNVTMELYSPDYVVTQKSPNDEFEVKPIY